MKKLLNDPRRVVREMLEGIADITTGVALLDREDVLVRDDVPSAPARPVAVISGGGAGHEPAHAGYVGAGMLAAAVVGDVFTSPSVDAVLAAILAVGGPRGVLLVVKNYTGDRLNFGLAAELARARGIPAEIVVVADDVALREIVEPARRRGIAGTVLVHKVAGAIAASGADLVSVASAARRVAAGIGTMGVALGACVVPAAGRPGFELDADEIEIGLGIHGEQGVSRIRIEPADRLVDRLIETILMDRNIGRDARVALLINGLGGTPAMELAIVARRAVACLRTKDVVIERVWCGTFLSAIEMPGCSISILPVDDGLLGWLDGETAAPAWPGSGRLPAERKILEADRVLASGERNQSQDHLGAVVHEAVLACASVLEEAEARLTELDSATGDGDLGISLARGANAVRDLPAGPSDAASTLTAIADALRRAIAGSSGPFYAIALARAARHVAAADRLDADTWVEAFGLGVAGICELGGAREGDRTMVDALLPAVASLSASFASGLLPADAALDVAARAAETAAANTSSMRPRLGRAAYLGDRAMGVPDAGATAVAIWFRALADHLAATRNFAPEIL